MSDEKQRLSAIWAAQNEQVIKDYAALGRAGGEAFAVLAGAFGALLRATHKLMWGLYRNEGAPYGETEEGLHRWMEDRRRERDGDRRARWEQSVRDARS